MNNYERVKEHLEKRGTITSWEAIKKYRITRLSHYIYLLRNEGYVINGEWQTKERAGEHLRWKVYRLNRIETEIRKHIPVID